jgi:hypothetical protein
MTILSLKKNNMAGRVAQVLEHLLPSKCKSQSSNPSIVKKKKKAKMIIFVVPLGLSTPYVSSLNIHRLLILNAYIFLDKKRWSVL